MAASFLMGQSTRELLINQVSKDNLVQGVQRGTLHDSAVGIEDHRARTQTAKFDFLIASSAPAQPASSLFPYHVLALFK